MKKEAEALVQLGKYLFDRNYANGSAGNISVLLEDGKKLLASPSGSNLGAMSSTDLSLCSLHGELLAGPKATKELNIHLTIYQNSLNSRVIIHLHSCYLTALSCLQGLNPKNVIRPVTPYIVMRVGEVPLIPYNNPGSIKIAQDITPLVQQHSAFLLANHGVVVVGDSIEQACHNFEELEEAARLYFLLCDSRVNYLDAEQIAELKRIKP